MPIDRKEAHLFFQFISNRYERARTIITSNKSFVEWEDMFGAQVIATAIVDRLLHHCRVVNIEGNSYRMKNYQVTASGGMIVAKRITNHFGGSQTGTLFNDQNWYIYTWPLTNV